MTSSLYTHETTQSVALLYNRVTRTLFSGKATNLALRCCAVDPHTCAANVAAPPAHAACPALACQARIAVLSACCHAHEDTTWSAQLSCKALRAMRPHFGIYFDACLCVHSRSLLAASRNSPRPRYTCLESARYVPFHRLLCPLRVNSRRSQDLLSYCTFREALLFPLQMHCFRVRPTVLLFTRHWVVCWKPLARHRGQASLELEQERSRSLQQEVIPVLVSLMKFTLFTALQLPHL